MDRQFYAGSEEVTNGGLSVWMRVGQPIEGLLDDHERLFDAWESGGVRGLLFGRLLFRATGWATGVPAYAPDPSVYAKYGVEPPPAPTENLADERRKLDAFLEAARERGWPVYLFEPAATFVTEPGSLLTSESARRAYLARLEDAIQHFPMATGAILDGPEWGYEIDPDHRQFIFGERLEGDGATKARELGYDADEINRGIDSFQRSLGKLTSDTVARLSGEGMLNALRVLGVEDGAADWLQFRANSVTDFFRAVRSSMDEYSPETKLGLGTRSPCFTALTGSDQRALSEVVQVLLPKHYFWQRGYDGLYGTVFRYVCTLTERNDISDREALAVVESLFGFRLANVRGRLEIELGPTEEFYAEVVPDETRRSLSVVDDPARVVAWVDTGRKPHEGEPMTARDLYLILTESARAGLRSFVYHSHVHLTKSEWSVISSICGEPWRASDHGYEPPDGSRMTG